jgi:hypothetical protein
MLAKLDPNWETIIGFAAPLMIFGLLGFAILKGLRWFKAISQRAQARAYEGVTISEQPAPGLMNVVFHAYSGVLVFVIQSEHRFWASPDEARLVLRRLHRFNLTWGFFAYGALVIPLFSYGNYVAQQRRISKQAARTAA